MENNHADYSEIADVYDTTRTTNKPHIAWWVKKLGEVGELGPGKHLLDLGCGTGRWALLLAQQTGCDVTGVDNSPEMLAKAREKDPEGLVTWIEGDVYRPPVPQRTYDAALLSLVLHHLEDPYVALRAAYVALRPGGVLMIRQGTLDQIVDDPAHRFFPEALTIDLKRTPLRHEVESWLYKAGFTDVWNEKAQMRTHHTPQEWLDEVGLRVCSVLRLISDEAFQRGFAQLREYIEQHPDDPWLVEESMTLFVAKRPG